MSEYIKTDVGVYLASKTGNFEKSPPAELWKNIESNIPAYSGFIANKVLLKYIIGGISLSAIIIAFLLFYFQPFSAEKNNSIPSIAQSAIPVLNKVVSNNKKIITEPENIIKNNAISVNDNFQKTINTDNKNSKKENTLKVETNIKKDNSVIYSINASGLKNVTAITFINDKNETVLVSKNPTPNSFGFYIIDISQLAKGTYNIMISNSEGTKLHKRETFK
jgi:hypothetical protein